MTPRQSCWGCVLFAIFLLALAVAGYFVFQLPRSAPPAPANFLAADKGYGVTVDLTQYDEATLVNTLTALHKNGLTWLRQPVSWAEIEPAPGQFNWSSLERAVGQVVNLPYKINLILVLQTTPAWARAANTPPMTPPTEVSDFGAFARALVERYGDQIDYYQIWHEPNLSANWGNAFVNPSAYTDLLREATLNIHAVDSTAFILSAALAPTLESGPLNLNELDYLDQLYQAKANHWFDIVAGQPYGFGSEPADPAQGHALNFRRIELLRQVMLKHGDAATPIWATAFGWNALPAGWTGQPSPWESDTLTVQAQRTAEAIAQARHDWPWLGPILMIRWDATNLAAADPARGFAVAETPSILEAIHLAATDAPIATPGQYPASHPTGRYSSGWRFAQTLADIPHDPSRTLTIRFAGTHLDLLVNRGPFRGYLWVTIDGQPANALPQDDQGRSYVVLYDPLRASEAVKLAKYLPPGSHEAVIEAEGGWGQWAIGGWTVYHETDTRLAQSGLTVAIVLAVLSGLAWLGWIGRAPGERLKWFWAWGEIGVALYAVLGERGQIIGAFVLAMGFYLAPEWLALTLLPLLTLAILLRPDLGLALVAFSLSFFQAPKQLLIGRFSPVELALALTIVGFVFRGLLFLGRATFTNETTDHARHTSNLKSAEGRQSEIPNLKSADWAALTLVVLAFAATLAAQNFGVSLREWRVVVVESVVFYLLVRLGLDYRPQPVDRRPPTRDRRPETGDDLSTRFANPLRESASRTRFANFQSPISKPQSPPTWAWRLMDAFIAGAVLQALIALYLYFFTDQSITAEGVRRALGLAYGSPNNLSLFLDRAWPILLAVTIWPGRSTATNAARPMPGNSGELKGTQGNSRELKFPLSSPQLLFGLRRWLYGVGLFIVSVALYLTFSKGALFLGLPAGVVAMGLFYVQRSQKRNWRSLLIAAVVGLIIIAVAVIPLSQTERFRTTFDFDQGSTGFFRLKLWQASLTMLRDHWLLGVGLDNFLYQYRTRYILPEAWQEPNLSHPHNLILDFGTRLGLGGIAVLLWLQVAFWRNAWQLYQKSPHALLLGLMGSMAVFLAHGLVDNSYFLVDLAFAFFLIVGVVQGMVDQQ